MLKTKRCYSEKPSAYYCYVKMKISVFSYISISVLLMCKKSKESTTLFLLPIKLFSVYIKLRNIDGTL